MSLREAALAGSVPDPALAPRSVRRRLRALWYRRSVRLQLVIIFALIEFVAALVAGGVTILKARTATKVEIAASLELARLLVGEAVTLMQQEVPAERFLADLSSQLRLVRHVRIGVKDAAGNPLAVRPPRGGAEMLRGDDRAPAPAWFAALIAPSIESRRVPVVVNGQPFGSVEIVSEPTDEIAEVWENAVALAGVTLVVNLVAIGILYFLFGRVLDPLTGLARGLADLEREMYAVRLPPPRPQELAAITERFNALAEALETARAENLKLSHRLVTAQDDERRRTALDLHDEVGPSLFGLKANAASVAKAASELSGDAARDVQERVRDLLAIVDHLQTTNRSILNRLRPMALGHVPLRELLSDLVGERARANPQMAFSFESGNLERSYGDSIDLTIYRCVQESMTNAIRHAQAKHVGIAVAEAPGGRALGDTAARELHVTVRDDGLGIDPARPKGYGIRGMQERVEALGGRSAVESDGGRGTCVRIAIPSRRTGGSTDRFNRVDGLA
ncbi:MAG: two-component system, NarL family, sensor histidine kinase UhpB [Alphaproteobacteria bacterium]|jgi:two-component system sensor histidine kinase UhpB|nr:two-component system, NarL family, sensor histidine kinase UhpB [Alphaproteobacteria bacterium]